MNTKTFQSYISLAISMTLAGSSVVVSKQLVQHFPVFLASGGSLFIALCFLIPFSLLRYGQKFPRDKKTLRIFFLQGFTGTFLFRVFLFWGLTRTSATAGGLITSSAPAFVGIMALLILKEKFQWNKFLGILFTISGMLLVNVSTASGSGAGTLAGNLLVLAAVFGESLFSIFSKLPVEDLPTLVKATVICTFAFLCFVPFSIYDWLHFDVTAVHWTTWASLVYYGLGVTVLAFVLWFQGIRDTQASTSAVFSGFMPLSSVLLSGLLLGEDITIYHILSLFLILLGLFANIGIHNRCKMTK